MSGFDINTSINARVRHVRQLVQFPGRDSPCNLLAMSNELDSVSRHMILSPIRSPAIWKKKEVLYNGRSAASPISFDPSGVRENA